MTKVAVSELWSTPIYIRQIRALTCTFFSTLARVFFVRYFNADILGCEPQTVGMIWDLRCLRYANIAANITLELWGRDMTSFTLHQEFLLVPETNIKNITVKEAHQTVYEDRISRDTNNHFVSEERCFSVYMDIFMTILKNNASSIPPA